MLVLTRRDGQAVRIGKDVVVRVTKIHRGSVRIAFDAPEGVRVLREELQEKESEDAA